VFGAVGALHYFTLCLLQSERPTNADQLKLVAGHFLAGPIRLLRKLCLDTKDSTHAVLWSVEKSIKVSQGSKERAAANSRVDI